MQIRKKYLFALVMALMVVPPLMKELSATFGFSISPLKGYIKYATKPDFTWHAWFDGSFQEGYDKYLEDHIGLRNIFVRIHNQIDFSLFNIGHGAGIVIGKDHYLYETNYILAYTGKDFLGEEFIMEKCRKIRSVQDSLLNYNTHLVVVLPPGKASFFPEYIPDEFMDDGIGITNNKTYLRHFIENGIHHLDFNGWFTAMRDTSRLPLYHKCGIHWNIYGAYLALDSLIRYIEDVKSFDMVDINTAGIEMSKKPRYTDYDIGDALNLLFRIPGRAMPYPVGFSYDTTGKEKPNLMVIADSYYWTIYNLPDSKLLWGEQDFRYYNQASYTPGKKEESPAVLTIEELAKFDVIMVMYTEANMTKFADDFFEDAWLTFNYRKEIDSLRTKIINSPDWMNDIQRKADEKGISRDDMLRLDAIWLLKHEMEKQQQTKKENGI